MGDPVVCLDLAELRASGRTVVFDGEDQTTNPIADQKAEIITLAISFHEVLHFAHAFLAHRDQALPRAVEIRNNRDDDCHNQRH
jgi:hypothetical protein